jgi:hypothetical protein
MRGSGIVSLERLNMKLDRKLVQFEIHTANLRCRGTVTNTTTRPLLPSLHVFSTAHLTIHHASSRNKQCLLVQALKLETLRLRRSFSPAGAHKLTS